MNADKQEVIALLQTAKKLISDPKNWSKGNFKHTRPDGTIAYCAAGALGAEGDSSAAFHNAINLLRSEIPSWALGLAQYNDHFGTRHEDIMDLYDRTIQRAKETT